MNTLNAQLKKLLLGFCLHKESVGILLNYRKSAFMLLSPRLNFAD